MITATEPSIIRFLSFLEREKKSESTIESYRRGLNKFHSFLRTINLGGVPASWGRVNQEVIKDFLAYMDTRRPKRKPIAPSTKSQRFSAVRAFFRFLVAEGHVKSDPTEGIASPQVPKTLPKPLSVQQVDELLEQPAKRNTPEARRDHAMFKLLYTNGLEVTELLDLNVDNISLYTSRPNVRCKGRGGKKRTMPINEQTLLILTNYVTEARQTLLSGKKEKALFVSHHGKRITRGGFWELLKKHAREAKIESPVTSRVLRHSVATHTLRGGAPLRNVQELLGHNHISTTQIYAEIVDENTHEVYESAHPRAKQGED